ncbi:MAG: Transcriptional regulator, ArsR family [Myxococcaceae bacterium]|jgi:ArsR family transcriptional regulator|nr:Transcriptional regulator, ArsR family [Myxococcaceae bacterium]
MARRDDHHPYEALADPVRRGILDLLRTGSRTAGDIADQFHVSKPTLSHHLGVLRSAGLVRSERRGTNVVYTLQTNVFEELAADLLDLAAAALGRKRKVKS